MKIGIITMPLLMNYGGILQNYALQTVLRDLGHNPITFRMDKKEYLGWIISSIKAIIRFRRPSIPPWVFRKRFSGMERFVDQYINVTRRQDFFSKQNIQEYQLDALCVGSDQIWRPKYMYYMHIEDMFFHFARGYKMLKFSYAASFGTSEWEFTSEQTNACRALIKQFHGVSVRESSGVALCKEYFGVQAQWVLDPTLLLSSSHYESLCEDIPIAEKNVFAYLLDVSPDKKAFVQKIAKQLGLKAAIISAGADMNSEDCPERWIANFRDAAFVVTDSFHGTAFSIIFRRDFLTFTNAQRGNARFDSLVKIFSIENQIIKDTDIDVTMKKPDWNNIENQLSKWKDKSISYLFETINNK